MAPKRRIKVPKITPDDKQKILHELDAWYRGERAGRLTWAQLERVSGFTRQALSNHREIVERYGEAKALNRPNGASSKPSPRKTVDQRVLDLQREVERLRSIIGRYDERWARYARNAALLGYDLERLEVQLDPPARAVVWVNKANHSR